MGAARCTKHHVMWNMEWQDRPHSPAPERMKMIENKLTRPVLSLKITAPPCPHCILPILPKE